MSGFNVPKNRAGRLGPDLAPLRAPVPEKWHTKQLRASAKALAAKVEEHNARLADMQESGRRLDSATDEEFLEWMAQAGPLEGVRAWLPFLVDDKALVDSLLEFRTQEAEVRRSASTTKLEQAEKVKARLHETWRKSFNCEVPQGMANFHVCVPEYRDLHLEAENLRSNRRELHQELLRRRIAIDKFNSELRGAFNGIA